MNDPIRIDSTGICDCSASNNAEQLNTHCLCPQQPVTIENDANGSRLQIAAVPVFVSTADYDRMAQLIATIDRIVHTTAWQDKVLAIAPAIALQNPGNAGVLYGFDFHLHENGPQLIEINTNAGGALIVTQVLRAQSGCCASGASTSPACQAQQAEAEIIDSLLSDFEQVRGHRCPRLVAIVDREPAQQYLFPEFQRFAELLRQRDIAVEICDPSELKLTHDGLTLHDVPVDLIYNRLIDFYFEDNSLRALREAYLNGTVVVTPNPQHHALYADKRLLALLSDSRVLDELGVEPAQQQILLHGIPETHLVDAANAEQLWAQRKEYFFKPTAAYGSKGAYRGAKLTRGTFDELLKRDYVAQREISPPLRRAQVDGESIDLKIDVRCYVYRGAIQLTAVRLWRGQTTNFRTAGGGFATVNRTML